MELEAHPSIINVVFFLQPIDNALADIAERSDVVGKYFDFDDHGLFPSMEPQMNNFNIPAFFLISR